MAGRTLASCAALALCLACGPVATGRPPVGVPEAAGSVVGRVTGQGGKAVEGAVVTLRGPEGSRELGAVSGADGSFTVPSAEPDAWRLFAAASGYLDYGPRRVRVRPGETTRVEVRLEAIPEPPRFRKGPDGALALPKKLARLPSGWRVVDVGDVAAFAMPDTWKARQPPDQDAWVGDFEGDGVVFAYRFGYTYGPFACPAGAPCDEGAVILGGRGAQFITYEDREPSRAVSRFVGLYFPDVGGGASFSMWGYASRPEDLKALEAVFKTVAFP